MPPITQDNIEINKSYNTYHKTKDCFEKSKRFFGLNFPRILFTRIILSGFVSNFELSIDTSSRMVGIRNNIKETFLNITDADSGSTLKIITLKRNIDSLLKNNLHVSMEV
ncbi:MAG: hypothetical protein R2805_04815 [Flavobacterium sp.]|uniref:hypothetical protein n=1 Tax=Flavobacterium sp. TaxID=239 RepID=UPI003528E4C2